MIQLIKSGKYTLIETKQQTKIIKLDDGKTYAWITAANIGDILFESYTPHQVDHILAIGHYRLYDVRDEPKLTDLQHLELFVGDGKWQGYLLTTGLPTNEKKRRIIPTKEIITIASH